MSSMFPGGGGSPSAINIGGPAHGSPADSDSGPGDSDSGSVTDKLKKAMSLMQAAAAQEADDQDAAALTKIVSLIHTAIANEQGLVDKAMGAGPGVKLVRKASAGQAPAGGV